MQIRHVAFYELRIAFGGAALFGMLLLPGFALISVLQAHGWDPVRVPPNATLARDVALLLSLCAIVATSHLMTIERDEGFDLMRRSMPEPSWRLPLIRIMDALVMLVLSGAVALAIYLVAYEHNIGVLEEILLPTLPPIWVMLGASIFLSNVTGYAWVTMGLLIGYWFFDYTTRGTYTGEFYLFNSVLPNPDVNMDVNRALLLSIGGGLLLLSMWWNHWRRSRG